MKSILITGAGGLIGSRVVEQARNTGYAVTPVLHQECDLRLPIVNLPGTDAIFHLAGGYASAGRQSLEHADLRIAHNVIQWGREHGVKDWVFASAAEVYGCVDGLATETTHTRPEVPYGHIKLAIEDLLVQMAADVPDCRVVLLRIGVVYGRESRLLHELTKRLESGFCPWPGAGRVVVSFVHVEDVAQAFLWAIERAPRGVSIYNVADDQPATWRSFVRRFAEVLGARPPVSLPRPLVYAYMLGHQLKSRLSRQEPLLTSHALRLLTTPKAMSTQKIKSELGFAPRFPNFRCGLEASLDGLSHHA